MYSGGPVLVENYASNPVPHDWLSAPHSTGVSIAKFSKSALQFSQICRLCMMTFVLDFDYGCRI